MTSERQLGLLWGLVALLLIALSPIAERLASALPTCPVKTAIGVPCLACGTTRAGMALSRLDVASAVFINPLIALAWIVLIGGGIAAGFLALFRVPLREPDWRLSRPARWLLILVLLINWAYLVGAGV